MKTISGEPRFPTLLRLMAGLLSTPCSHDDSERGFSMLYKITLTRDQAWITPP